MCTTIYQTKNYLYLPNVNDIHRVRGVYWTPIINYKAQHPRGHCALLVIESL